MNLASLLLALSPVIIIFLLLILRRTAGKIGAAGLLAAASIDRIGEESEVIRTTFVISLVITAVVGVMALIWAF